MEKGGNSGNIGARKPILALGELLVDLVPGREGMRIEDAGPVVKTASGSAGIFACAATLLGGRGGFIGKVGRDSLSRMVAGTLRGQGVDLSRLIVSDEGQMGLAFLEYLPEGRNYQYYRKNSVGTLNVNTTLRNSRMTCRHLALETSSLSQNTVGIHSHSLHCVLVQLYSLDFQAPDHSQLPN